MVMLGCADGYRVELVYVQAVDDAGDPLPQTVPVSQGALSGVTRIRWGRRLGGVSTAEITVGGPDGAGVCCDQIEAIQPEAFEVRLWRDGDDAAPVWEGVIHDDVETSHGQPYVIRAADVLSWAAGDNGRPNLVSVSYGNVDPTRIAERILQRNFGESPLAVPSDYGGFLDHLYIEPAGFGVDYMPGLEVVPVLDLLDDLTDLGLAYTVVGRSIFLMGGADTDTPVTAQLTQDDIDTPTELIGAGAEMATLGVAVRPGPTGDDPPDVFIEGEAASVYRPHFRVVDVDRDASDATARRAARLAIKGRTAPPLVVSMPEGRLFATAPISMDALSPGWVRVDFLTAGRGSAGICTPIRQPCTVATVDVDWVPGNETVRVGLLAIGEPTSIDPEPELEPGLGVAGG